ncbi:hypothetical protein [Streptomyces sp. enrichment culture]|uniref:hypothetical protein n=1 Tax=Streptomyces sp. enrichment culture TaxID=1795815 RepID=UPI003F54C050
MANTNPTRRRAQAAAPAVGSRPSVRIDADLAADLADLMRVHGSFTEAVRQAVGQLAAIYRTAWAHGIVPSDAAPTLAAFQFATPGGYRPRRPVPIPSDRPVGHVIAAPGQTPAPPHPAVRLHYAPAPDRQRR